MLHAAGVDIDDDLGEEAGGVVEGSETAAVVVGSWVVVVEDFGSGIDVVVVVLDIDVVVVHSKHTMNQTANKRIIVLFVFTK